MLKALEIVFGLILEKCMEAMGIVPVNFDLYAAVLLFSYMFGIFMLMYISFKMEKNELFYVFFFSIGIMTLWLYADLKKYLAIRPEEVMFWIRVEYFARMYSAPLWFALSEVYITRLDKFRKKPLTFIVAIFTFLYIAGGREIGNYGILVSRTVAPSDPSFVVGYFITYAVIIYSIFRLNRYAFRNKGVYINQAKLITHGIMFIFILDAVTVSQIVSLNFDIVPFGILACLLS
ncbi:MAG TPA: histidine kinase N-terminal 7TM domain-containing protein, partial [Candidatus Nitrosocosmicus sp.]|nr:histidine kinase N-terminal 7TM domain-containing protein [Candidatus Nitrosocosmicus sp.]